MDFVDHMSDLGQGSILYLVFCVHPLMSAKFQKLFCPSCIIMRIQKLESKESRFR